MIRKLFPVVIALVAFLGGAAAGDMLSSPTEAPDQATDATPSGAQTAADGDAAAGKAAPAAEAKDAHASPAPRAAAHAPGASGGSHGGSQAGSHEGGGREGSPDPAAPTWFKFPQQFFVPVLHDGQLDSTMILSLSAEMPAAAAENVFAHELKLRDALLRQLLIQANTGSFDGNFTAEAQLRRMRAELLASAQAVVPEISDILIGDIARQER